MSKDKHTFTIEDYQADLKRLSEQFAIAQVSERKNHLLDYLFVGGYEAKPLTKLQSFKYRMQDFKQRCKDIWTIVSGGDIHKNCGY